MVTMQGFKRQISQIEQGHKKWVNLSMSNPFLFQGLGGGGGGGVYIRLGEQIL